jgi:hypothetical protein
LLRDFEEVIIAFDGDIAGWNGQHHLVNELSPLMEVKVCPMYDDYDPACFSNFQEYLDEYTIRGATWTLEHK